MSNNTWKYESGILGFILFIVSIWAFLNRAEALAYLQGVSFIPETLGLYLFYGLMVYAVATFVVIGITIGLILLALIGIVGLMHD